MNGILVFEKRCLRSWFRAVGTRVPHTIPRATQSRVWCRISSVNERTHAMRAAFGPRLAALTALTVLVALFDVTIVEVR